METTLRPATRWSPAALALVLAAGLTACGESTPPGEGAQTTATATPTEEADPVVVAVHEDVDYYGACDNVVLVHEVDGETLVYYPLLREEQEELDLTRYGTGMGVRFGAVAPPGPGDDVGTLTIYEDGYATFVSDSGDEYWLHEDEREYNWVC